MVAPEDIVITADTMVFLDNRKLGKPQSEEEAFEMLSSLSGREHTVCTGVTVMQGNRMLTEAESTRVRFAPLDEDTIRAYIRTGEPMDKAGAYGAQGYGALLIEGIEGDFFNVMGLPSAACLVCSGNSTFPSCKAQVSPTAPHLPLHFPLQTRGTLYERIFRKARYLDPAGSRYRHSDHGGAVRIRHRRGNADSKRPGRGHCPFRSGISAVTNWVDDRIRFSEDYDALKEEVARLKEENARLAEENRQAQADSAEKRTAALPAEPAAQQREFQYESAMVVDHTSSNWTRTLTLNKGSSMGFLPRIA